MLEDADSEPDPAVRQALLTFVVAGGGFSGVEAVAALNDFIRQVAKHFRHLKPADLRIILLHAGARLHLRVLTPYGPSRPRLPHATCC